MKKFLLKLIINWLGYFKKFSEKWRNLLKFLDIVMSQHMLEIIILYLGMSEISWHTLIDDPDCYFKNKRVINFYIIHHGCRGDPLKKSYKEHKTVNNDNFKEYPEKEKNKTVSAIFRNKRGNLWVQRDLMIEDFRKIF